MAQLEFKDFSGGVTDKDIPGDFTRYSKAENLLISEDRKLYTRPGWDIFDPGQMVAGERIARLANFDNNTLLLGVQNKKVKFVSGGAWTDISGPTGNNAFNSNSAASLVETTEYNHQTYFTSDSGDPVVKLYRDEGGTLRMRTAGLPKPLTSAVYADDAAKLAAAIALAVDIRDAMIDHVDDYGADPAAHIAQDTAVSTALGALTTPTDLATLITYTKALRTQYNAHLADVRDNPYTSQVFHNQRSNRVSNFSGAIRDPILNVLADQALPADSVLNTLEETVAILNDLRNRYSWHVLAPWTHNNADEDSPSYGAHFITSPAINLDEKYPRATGQYAALLRYVNRMKEQFNAHLADGGNTPSLWAHRVSDTRGAIYMADATDLAEAVAMLGLFEFHYAVHYLDANQPYGDQIWGPSSTDTAQGLFTGDVNSGSPDITNVSVISGGSSIGYVINKTGQNTTAPYDWSYDSPFPNTAEIDSFPSPGTITMTENSTQTRTGVTFGITPGSMHYDIDITPGARTSSAWAAKNFYEKVDLSLEDLESITDFALEALTRFKSHATGRNQVIPADQLLLSETVLNPNITYYEYTETSFAGTIFRHHKTSQGSGAYSFFPYIIPTFVGEQPLLGQGYFEAGLEVASYNYRIVYRSDYFVGDEQFTDLSTPSDIFNVVGVLSGPSIIAGDTNARDPITFTNVPVLANAANQNYPTADLQVEFYRTQNNGTVYYLAGEVVNGATSFTDSILDDDLEENEPLYTNGGVLANDAPPVAPHIHILEGRMYYGRENLVYVSLQDDPDSVPETSYLAFDFTVVGISSTRSTVVVFTESAVYRMVGSFDDLGQGFLRSEVIFDKTGCISSQSIVKADNGIFFAGSDGFYYTDGFQCYRVADTKTIFQDYTTTLARRALIQGTYSPYEKRIYWAMQESASSLAPDAIWVLDLQFGVKLDGTPLTTFSGGFDGYAGFRPTALVVYEDKLHYGDDQGYVFFGDPSLNIDVKRDTGVAYSSWEKRTILWDWKSCHTDAGTPAFRKFFQRVTTQFNQETNISVQIISDADKGRIVDNLPIVRSRKLLDWGDPKIDWISSVYTAREGGVIDEFRRFKANGSLRSNYRAIELRNAFCVIVASKDMGTLTVANVSGDTYSLTLTSLVASRKWPLYSVDYQVEIAGVLYPVTSRVSDSVVQVSAAGLTAPTAGLVSSWEMWGYPKNEKVRFIQFTVDFQILGQEQKAYQGTVTTGGENP